MELNGLVHVGLNPSWWYDHGFEVNIVLSLLLNTWMMDVTVRVGEYEMCSFRFIRA